MLRSERKRSPCADSDLFRSCAVFEHFFPFKVAFGACVFWMQVGSLDDFHTFAHPNHPERHHEHAADKTASLHGHGEVGAVLQNLPVLARFRRPPCASEYFSTGDLLRAEAILLIQPSNVTRIPW